MGLRDCGAVVTGGASGLRAATARLLAAGIARVTIVDLDKTQGEAVASEIRGLFIKFDVTSSEAVDAALAAAAMFRFPVGWAIPRRMH